MRGSSERDCEGVKMEGREAIALLQNLKVGVKKYDEALKMAVEALKRQEGCDGKEKQQEN